MNFYRNISTLVFFLLLGISMRAQKNDAVVEELKKVNTSLKKCPSVKMDVAYTYFSSYTSKIPIEVQKGKIKKKGNSQYSSLLGTTTVLNDKYLLVVDSNSQRIIVSDRKTTSAPQEVNDIDLEKMMKIYNSPVPVTSGNLTGYKFVCKPNVNTEHSIIEIYYSKKNYVIEKLVFYYQQAMPVDPDKEDGAVDKPRLEIVFSNINLNAGLTDADFSEKNYIKIEGKEMKSLPKYNMFQVIKNNI